MTDRNDDARRGLLIEAMETIERLQQRVRAAEQPSREPIAVIGIGCRLPGGVDGPDSFWQLLEDGRDAVVEVPANRWDQEEYSSDDPSVPGTIRARAAGFLTHWDPDQFDASFFGISPREAAAMDPQQRLLLEVAWEALEHAGIPADRLRGSRTGVFTGITLHEYAIRQMRHLGPEDVDAYTVTSCLPNYASGRISYYLGLRGPSLAVDSACSSSLVTTHLACQSLRSGESDLALAAGTNLMLLPETSITLTRWGALAPDGRCKAFDASGDGLGRGEGCGVVVLKRLSDARRDGDRILAVIRGTAVNQDGASSNFTAPNGLAQEEAIRTALRNSELSPEDIDYIEAHGTGTSLGDPIELEALASVFADRDSEHPLIVGSAKTNLGHVEAAAGVTGLIKTVLALHHDHIPPHLHFRELTPRISSRAARLTVPADGADWPKVDRPSRAGVSSFGVSGTNAHVVVEAYRDEAPPLSLPVVEAAPEEAAAALYPLHAATPAALTEAARRLSDWLTTQGATTPLTDVGRTLALHRTRLPERLVVLARDRRELADRLAAFATDPATADAVAGRARQEEDAVWVFSGHGSQWAGMGRRLLTTEPAFAEVVDALEPVLREEGGFSLRDALATGEFGGLATCQPIIYALQVGLAAVWRSYGLRPAAVLGHSMGEVAAAVTAGALDLRDGARVMCRRSRLLEDHLVGTGVMAMVELPVEETRRRLSGTPDVTVAVHASPRTTVVAGPEAAVDELVAAWQADGLMARRVKGADAPGHSPMVDAITPLIRERLAGITPREPEVTVYTSALDDPRAVPAFDPGYWAANARNPVRFTEAVAAAAEDDHTVFLEVSPHPVVTHSVRETLETGGFTDTTVTGTLRRDEPERRSLLTALARLHTAGVTADWERLHPEGVAVALPTNPWQHERHWYTDSAPGAGARAATGHPLLGTGARIPGPPPQYAWRSTISLDRLPWLADHRAEGTVVMPGTAYCEMAFAAAAEAFGCEGAAEVLVHDVEYLKVLVLTEPVELTTVLTEETPGTGVVEVLAQDAAGEWVRHARARVRRETAARPAQDPAALAADHPVAGGAEELYARLRAAGQEHGPAFAGVTGIATGAGRPDSAVGRLTLPAPARTGARGVAVHPVLLDSGMQLLGAVPLAAATLSADDPDAGGVLLPVGIGSLRVWGDPATAALCRATVERPDPADDARQADLLGAVELLDPAGEVVVEARGIRLNWLRDAAGQPAVTALFHELTWESAPLPAPAAVPAGGLVVVAESADDPLAAALRDLVGEAACRLVPAGEPGAWASATAPAPRAVVFLPASADADAATRQTDPDSALAHAEDRVARLIELARSLATADGDPTPRLWVVARGAQSVTGDEPVAPEQAALRGVVRTLGWEHRELRASLVDLGAGTPAGPAAAALAAELAADGDEDEVALRDGVRHVARMVAVPDAGDRLPRRRLAGERAGFRLESTAPGVIDSVRPVFRERTRPGAGMVEIRVEAAGVNFSDVLKSMGWYKMPEGDRRELHLGGECAGVITAVGPDVEGLSVGDRVVAIAFHSFADHAVTRAELVAPLPASLDAATAAALPTAYGTAWYGLVEAGRLDKGERVLIHAASGGVGLAAVSIAQGLGAEVYATAGSEAKRAFLRSLGVTTVMDSRSLSWAEEIRAATGGEGVDVVLNSLPGEAIRLGLESLAPGGRFVELGKRDIHEDLRLGLLPFARALTLSAVDYDLLSRSRPAVVGRILRQTVEAVAEGVWDTLPHTDFPVDRAVDAFRTMAAAEHIGKLVITLDGQLPEEALVRPATIPVARPDGSYVISGGLTGIGLETARHLAGHGAGLLVLNGRREPGPDARRTIEEIRAAGTEVEVVLGDVAEPGVAARLVDAARSGDRTLRGVVHSAAALDDAAVLQQDRERLHRAWWPKAVGAWRLHQATQDAGLDWWIGYSSTTSLLGAAGQANYAAACAYLDGLAQWRTRRGLPALSVDWGPWAAVGRGQALAERGYRMITPDRGFAALDELITQGRTRTGVLDFDAAEWFAAFPEAAASPLYGRVRDQDTAGGEDTAAARVPAELAALPPGPARRERLEEHVIDQVRAVLRLGRAPVDPLAPLSTFGIDSLMALELRNRLEAGLGLKLPATLVWAHPTLGALAENLAGRLGLELDAPAVPEEPSPELASEDDELLAQILLAADTAADDGSSEEHA